LTTSKSGLITQNIHNKTTSIELQIYVVNLKRLLRTGTRTFPNNNWGGSVLTADICAFKGDKKNPLENLKAYNHVRQTYQWMALLFKTDPLL
jgi:hypothetical protein